MRCRIIEIGDLPLYNEDLENKAPAEWTPPEFALANFTLPGEIPASLPCELVHRRPDILAAAANMHSASAEIGVAMIARKGVPRAQEPNLVRFTCDRSGEALAKLENQKLVEWVDSGPVLQWQVVNNS